MHKKQGLTDLEYKACRVWNRRIQAELQEFEDKCEFEFAYWEQQLAECLQAERSKQARRARAIDILLRRWCRAGRQASSGVEGRHEE